jgi:hypothetical protein
LHDAGSENRYGRRTGRGVNQLSQAPGWLDIGESAPQRAGREANPACCQAPQAHQEEHLRERYRTRAQMLIGRYRKDRRAQNPAEHAQGEEQAEFEQRRIADLFD